MSAANVSQTKKAVTVRVQAEIRVSVRATVIKPIRLMQIEHVQSVEMGELRR